jgi:APA family basic amino acid/polyamine antiporter
LLKRLGPRELEALGIGCIIGVGIFILPGVQAAKNAGPGIVLSFAIAAAAPTMVASTRAAYAFRQPGLRQWARIKPPEELH